MKGLRQELTRDTPKPSEGGSVGSVEDTLISRCKAGDLAGVQSCIQAGADLATREPATSLTGLHHAAERGHTGVVSLLLDMGAGYRLGKVG